MNSGGGVDRLDGLDQVALQMENGEPGARRIAANQRCRRRRTAVRRSASSGRTGPTRTRALPAPAAGGRRSRRRPAWPAPARWARSPAGTSVIERHRPVGDVADREDGRIGGARLEVDHDPVGAFQARVPRHLVVGQGADADQGGIAGDQRPSDSLTPLTRPPSPTISSTPTPSSKWTPRRAVIGLEEARQRLARHPRQHPRLQLDHSRLRAQRAGRGGDLQADIAAADHRQPAAGPSAAFSCLGVRRRAQRQTPARSTPGMASRRARAPVARIRRRRRRSRRRSAGPSWSPSMARDPDAQAQVDALLGVEALAASAPASSSASPFSQAFDSGGRW